MERPTDLTKVSRVVVTLELESLITFQGLSQLVTSWIYVTLCPAEALSFEAASAAR